MIILLCIVDIIFSVGCSLGFWTYAQNNLNTLLMANAGILALCLYKMHNLEEGIEEDEGEEDDVCLSCGASYFECECDDEEEEEDY